MSASTAGKRRRTRMKAAKSSKPAVDPMEFVGFEGARHMVPERLPSARKEKTVGIRVIDLNKGAMDNIKEMGPSLRRLDLSDLRLAKLNEEFLTCLRQLEKLDLENNELTEESFPLALSKVDKLVELSLERNKLAAFPQIIRKLKELRRLKLGRNRLTSVEGIQRLKRLQILILDNNQLETIPRELFQNLKKLEILHLANNKLRDIHPDIKCLRYLKDVHLGNNKLRTLPTDLLLLPRLEVLNASGNKISRVPTINVKGRGGRKLASIDLSCNVLIKFPDHLLAMSDKLDLCRNRIRSIPATMLKRTDGSSQQEVLISENPLVSPPQDICECGLHSIMQYFQEAKAETKVYQGLKVLVLGASGSGKTSLVQTLLDQQPRLTPSGQVTVGVDMYDLDTDIEREAISDESQLPSDTDSDDEAGGSHTHRRPKIPLKSLPFSVWDFSGHPQYLQSHYYFIHDPCLVLLAFNMEEYREESFRSQVGFWVEYVLSKSHKICLLPVATKSDMVSPERAVEICRSVHQQIADFVQTLKQSVQVEIESIEKLAHIPFTMSEQLKHYLRLMRVEVHTAPRVMAVSCAQYSGIEELVTAMQDIALDKELFPNVMRTIPSRWCEVEDYVEERAWTMDLPFMRWEAYCEEITKRYGMKHLMVPITQYLHDVGKVIWYSNHSHLKDFVFLRPSWLADVIKHVFRHNTAEIDYNIEENFKHSGLSMDKFNKLSKTITEEGLVDRDYLKGAWAGLIPPDSTKAVVEVMVILLEFFELGYQVPKPGTKEVRMSLATSFDSLRPLERSDSMSSLVSTRAEELQQDSTESLKPKGKAGRKKAKKDEPAPIPKITTLSVPFIRAIPKSKDIEHDLYPYRYNLSVTPVYKFPHFCPPGFFETMCVRLLKPEHGCKVVEDWQGGLYAKFTDRPYVVVLSKVQDEKSSAVWIRVEVHHQDSDADEGEVEQMWGAVLPYLKHVEDLLDKFLGAYLKRFLECPKCGALEGFIGEWLTPKELQGLSHKTCSQCHQDVATLYLIQPKEKKRVEEFLLRKLKREAEKRQSSLLMEQIAEESANQVTENESQPTNQNGHGMTSPVFEYNPAPINGQENHLTTSSGGNVAAHVEEKAGNIGDQYKGTDIEASHGQTKGNEYKDVATSPTHSASRKQSANGRPKSRQSPPAGKYLVRDLEEQKRLFEQPTHKAGRGVEQNQQTD